MVSDNVVASTSLEERHAVLMEGLEEEEEEEDPEFDPVLLRPPALVRSVPFPNLRVPAGEL